MDRIALAFSPLRDASPRDVVAWSRSAEERGYEAVFIPESYCDSLAYAEAVALATRRLRVGTGITNVYLRQPTLLAAQAAAPQPCTRRGACSRATRTCHSTATCSCEAGSRKTSNGSGQRGGGATSQPRSRR